LITSDLVEKKIDFILKKGIFSVGSTKRENSLWPHDPLPGQKSIRLDKKGGYPSFPDAGLRRFSLSLPSPPRLFAETKRGEV
jgi:hypothetical protein